METITLAFPHCIQTVGERTRVKKLINEGHAIALIVHHVAPASDSDISRLLGVLAQQRGLTSITFKHMTFPGMQAHLAISFMSRYTDVAVTFDACAFLDYRHCSVTVAHPCTSIELIGCVIHPRDCTDFISSIVSPAKHFTVTRVGRCLGDAFVVSGKTD